MPHGRAQNLSTINRHDIAFARMVGIVKYFYPLKNVNDINGGNFTIHTLYQIEFAKYLGVSQTLISFIEKGTRFPSGKLLKTPINKENTTI